MDPPGASIGPEAFAAKVHSPGFAWHRVLAEARAQLAWITKSNSKEM
jgi:hypothetical protein